MFKRYEYDGVLYPSEQAVRKAIFDSKKIAIGRAPKGDDRFWEKYGVTISDSVPTELLKKQTEMKVKQAFLQWRSSRATLTSSLGFVVDSNERAKSDVDGLIDMCETMGVATVTFRDANNEFHSLTLEDLKTIKLEIIQNGSYAYEQKWALDAKVDTAQTKEDLDSISIMFVGKDFRKE